MVDHDDAASRGTSADPGDETVAVTVPLHAEDVVRWMESTAELLRSGRLDADELIRVLGELRAASTAFANASDWALLAAREAGASLRQVARAFGKGYVRSPAARLEKVHREAVNSDEFLDLVRRHGGGQARAHSD